MPGLLNKEHQKRYEDFTKRAKDAGFELSRSVLNAVDFGVPQVRRRVFVIGINRKIHGDAFFEFPKGEGPLRTVADVLWNLPEPLVYDRHVDSYDIPFHPNHVCLRPRSKRFSDGSLQPGTALGR